MANNIGILDERHLEFLELLEGKALKSFLNKYKITAPVSKIERRKKILDNIVREAQENKIPIQDFEEWITRWYIPGNKNVFIYELEDDTVNRLKDFDEIDTLINVSKLRENIGSIEETDKPIDPKLILLNVKNEQNDVKFIELGFVQLGQLRELDEENDSIQWTPINYYVYAEINLVNGQLFVWIEPTKKLHKLGNSKKGSFQDVAEQYKQIISGMFNLRFKDNLWISKVLYLMWQEDTKIMDETIQTKIALCREEINKMVKEHLTTLEIDKFTVEEVESRILALYEGLLIRQNGISNAEKSGWVRRHKVFDGTATVETFNDLPLYNSTSHYGLQAIVNEVGEVNKLEYAWNADNGVEEQVITTITVLNGCFVVNFWGYREEEEIRYVLSGINEYKGKCSNPPGDSQ
ncbi:hypothetical protein H7S55_14705 [Priestia aryabhattai]|uniref:hypothetical protein n=1 Tax=Priestia aryabhattai TaxID=412384 RepID=UPI001C8DE109|nr:hypothetical protein [Priestia aryabhattai]MBY0001426.1 hypothetical protein [Priestia aryabhattai]